MGFTYSSLQVLKDCTMYDCACLQPKPHLQDMHLQMISCSNDHSGEKLCLVSAKHEALRNRQCYLLVWCWQT